MPLTTTKLKEDILVNFGYGVLPVELTPEALNLAITNTLDTYNKYKSNMRFENFSVTSGGASHFDLPTDVTGVRSVEITPPIAGTYSSTGDLESAMVSGYPLFYSTSYGMYDMQTYDLRLRWLKTVQRELALDPDWACSVDPDTLRHTLYIYTSRAVKVTAHVFIPHKDDLTTIPNYSQSWFRRFAINEAKGILGQIRSKFTSIPVAGDKMTLNGIQLLNDYAKDREILLREIEASRSDLAPVYS